jgi:hypothetical protein
MDRREVLKLVEAQTLILVSVFARFSDTCIHLCMSIQVQANKF